MMSLHILLLYSSFLLTMYKVLLIYGYHRNESVYLSCIHIDIEVIIDSIELIEAYIITNVLVFDTFLSSNLKKITSFPKKIIGLKTIGKKQIVH